MQEDDENSRTFFDDMGRRACVVSASCAEATLLKMGHARPSADKGQQKRSLGDSGKSKSMPIAVDGDSTVFGTQRSSQANKLSLLGCY